MKLWAIQWDHDGPKIKYNLLRPREARYGLAGLLLDWHDFQIQVEFFGLCFTIKRPQEGRQ